MTDIQMKGAFWERGRWRHLILILILIAAVLPRCYEIGLPYYKQHETGFQETLALNHLEYGLLNNHFLSLMAEIDSQKYFHVSHPPLLHYILALAFALLGGSELAARIAILPFSLGSVALVFLLAERHLSRRIAVTASLFMAFSVLSSYFGRIVNFEVMAQFFVLLFVFQYLRYREQRTRFDLALLIAVLILGFLSDWPFYFVLPGVLAYELLLPDSRQRWREAALPLMLIGAGLVVVVLYGKYQDFATGHMVLMSRGADRMDFHLMVDPIFYKRLFKRMMRYAPVLLFLSVPGALTALDRRNRGLAVVVPILVVPILYTGVFANAAFVHEWTLYYFAAPLSLLAAIALEYLVTRTRYLKFLAVLFAVSIQLVMSFRMHEQAKQGVYSSLYDLSIFLRRSLPANSTIYSAILCQVSYYTHGKAAVIFPFAKGQPAANEYDCRVFDRLPGPSTSRKKVLMSAGDIEGYETVVTSSRYELLCKKELFQDFVFVAGGHVGEQNNRLLRIGEEVRLARFQPARILRRAQPVTRGAFEIEQGDTLTLSIGLSESVSSAAKGDGVEFIIRVRDEERSEEIFRQYIDPKNDESARRWHDYTIDLGAFEGHRVAFEFLTLPGPNDNPDHDHAFWGDARLMKATPDAG